jgi:hypothetical protein
MICYKKITHLILSGIWQVVATSNLGVSTMHYRPIRPLLFWFLLLQGVRPEYVIERTCPC